MRNAHLIIRPRYRSRNFKKLPPKKYTPVGESDHLLCCRVASRTSQNFLQLLRGLRNYLTAVLIHMIKATHILSKFRPVSTGEVRWVGTMMPRKQIYDTAGEAHMEKENMEPIVAFGRPPSIPFLGPLVALSILELWTKRDNNDD